MKTRGMTLLRRIVSICLLVALTAGAAVVARRFREHFGRRLQIDWLPAYAPQLNPDEQVWMQTKFPWWSHVMDFFGALAKWPETCEK
jgi:hypothetical protein